MTKEEAQAAVDAAQAALGALLPTQDEYDLAGLRPDTAAQDAAFGADIATTLRASLAAKEAASPAARLALTRAQRDLQPFLDAEGS